MELDDMAKDHILDNLKQNLKTFQKRELFTPINFFSEMGIESLADALKF